MNIFQFESLNLEFICKRYEINKFGSLKYENRAILRLFKSLGFNLQVFRGLRAKTRDGGLIPNKPRVSYAKPPREGVSGNLNRMIPSARPRLDLTVERVGAWRALTGGLGVSAN
jgi:hypothetical protein